MGRTSKNIKLRIPEKPHKIKGFRSGSYRVATTISSRSRYDLFDSPPYISTVFRALRKCKKNTQERYEIVKSEPTQSPVRRTFSADETTGASKNITLITLQLIQHQLILLYHTLTPFATLFPDRLAVLQSGRKKMETPLAFSAGMCYDDFDCTEKARTITCWIFSIFWAR